MPTQSSLISRRRSFAVALLIALSFMVLLPATSWAQIDPGVHTLHQNDRLVGLVLVPSRQATTCTYVEYWLLFDDYRYPSPEQPVGTTLRSPERLDPETLQRMSRGEGHWVTVEATEERSDCR